MVLYSKGYSLNYYFRKEYGLLL